MSWKDMFQFKKFKKQAEQYQAAALLAESRLRNEQEYTEELSLQLTAAEDRKIEAETKMSNALNKLTACEEQLATARSRGTDLSLRLEDARRYREQLNASREQEKKLAALADSVMSRNHYLEEKNGEQLAAVSELRQELSVLKGERDQLKQTVSDLEAAFEAKKETLKQETPKPQPRKRRGSH